MVWLLSEHIVLLWGIGHTMLPCGGVLVTACGTLMGYWSNHDAHGGVLVTLYCPAIEFWSWYIALWWGFGFSILPCGGTLVTVYCPVV